MKEIIRQSIPLLQLKLENRKKDLTNSKNRLINTLIDESGDGGDWINNTL